MRAYFITNGEPVVLWDWINGLLEALGEPPMTRFVAAELAKDHWVSIEAARRDLGYAPRVSMAEGTTELVAALRRTLR